MSIKKRFPFEDPVLEMLEVCYPNITRAKFPSLVPLAVRFPNLVSEAKMQMVDDEWRKLSVQPLPFDQKDMEPEKFWGAFSTVKDGTGSVQFSTFCSFMSSLFFVYHNVKRVFSLVNLTKTKSRNRLYTSTV